MAYSKLDEFAGKKLREKNVALGSSEKDAIFYANRRLNDGSVDVKGAVDMLRKGIGNKITEQDYRSIANDVNRQLFNKALY